MKYNYKWNKTVLSGSPKIPPVQVSKNMVKILFLLRLRVERFFLLFFCMTESLQIINRHRGSLLKILEKKSVFWESCTNVCHDLICSWPICSAHYYWDDFSHVFPPIPIPQSSHSSFNPSIPQTLLCKTLETQETLNGYFCQISLENISWGISFQKSPNTVWGRMCRSWKDRLERQILFCQQWEKCREFKLGRERINLSHGDCWKGGIGRRVKGSSE